MLDCKHGTQVSYPPSRHSSRPFIGKETNKRGKSRWSSNLGEHCVDVTQQEDDGENTRDADGEPVTPIVRTHPEDDPTEHDQKDTREVKLNHVVSQAPLQQERHFDDGEITWLKDFLKIE